MISVAPVSHLSVAKTLTFDFSFFKEDIQVRSFTFKVVKEFGVTTARLYFDCDWTEQSSLFVTLGNWQ